ncbi:hypothetical protein HNR15_001848 [Allobranchiibius huperziae]|uniref:Uncharacterized protein n=1 Tax=Allobranchiibius huperziae TaxID=1874116 RepID=A0A853DL64_9MICO|nr:hypothetical protein [Allobranchiibius huperziae]
MADSEHPERSEQPDRDDVVEDLQAPAEKANPHMRCQATCPPYTCLNPSCVATVME